eukprot:363759-Chlamydomonas_euryale.AAC.32
MSTAAGVKNSTCRRGRTCAESGPELVPRPCPHPAVSGLPCPFPSMSDGKHDALPSRRVKHKRYRRGVAPILQASDAGALLPSATLPDAPPPQSLASFPAPHPERMARSARRDVGVALGWPAGLART